MTRTAGHHGALVVALLGAFCGLGACKNSVDDQAGTKPAAAAVEAAPPTLPSATPTAAPAAAGADPCISACQRSRDLKCPDAARCEATCVALRDSEPCGNEMRAALRCFAAQPVASWECGEDGMAAIREGFCGDQQQQVVTCLSNQPGNARN